MPLPTRNMPGLLLVTLLFYLTTGAHADESKNEATSGHDHARQRAREDARTTDVALKQRFSEVLQQLRNAEYPHGDAEHIANTAKALADDQQRWRNYRDSHCNYQAYRYIYPADSRMFASEYHRCHADMNRERIDFLDGIARETNSPEQ